MKREENNNKDEVTLTFSREELNAISWALFEVGFIGKHEFINIQLCDELENAIDDVLDNKKI